MQDLRTGITLPLGEVPDLVGHREGAAVTYSELLSASVFMFYLLFMSLTLTQKTVNSSKKEKRIGWDYLFSFVSFSSVKKVAQESGFLFASISMGNPAQWQKSLTGVSTGVVGIKELL